MLRRIGRANPLRKTARNAVITLLNHGLQKCELHFAARDDVLGIARDGIQMLFLRTPSRYVGRLLLISKSMRISELCSQKKAVFFIHPERLNSCSTRRCQANDVRATEIEMV